MITKEPLSGETKTALCFYLVFAGLILLAGSLPDTKPVIPAFLERTDSMLPSGQPAFLSLQNSFETAWEGALTASGYDPENLSPIKQTRLQEKSYGKFEVNWVSAESCLFLPPGSPDEQLVNLGVKWKNVAESFNLEVVEAYWGYARQHLWIKLISRAGLNLPDRRISVVFQEITIFQPGNGSPGNKINWEQLFPNPPSDRNLQEIIPEIETRLNRVGITPPPATNSEPLIPKPGKTARVAIIIDDVGFVREPAEALLQVPARLTWAILPLAPHSREYAEAAHARNFEILLHLPLEPLSATADPGPGLIRENFSDQEILRQLDLDLSEAPGAVGVNNHMGSAGTENDRLMEILMRAFKKRRLFFVDSFTTADSVAEKYARIYQVPYAKRRVFIDLHESLETKKAALHELIKAALQDGEAIGIGHARPGTGQAIREMLPEFRKAGVEIVPVSELVR